MKYLGIGVGMVVLLLTLLIFSLPRWVAHEGSGVERRENLASVLPSSLDGVVIEDLPLGPNEYVDQKARDKLDYDDVVYRSYQSGSGIFSVYVAYWNAGRYSPGFITSHTPDRCWTLAGMSCLEFQTKYTLISGKQKLKGAEWRIFSAPEGGHIHVVFWHLVGDELYDYGGKFHSYMKPYVDPANRVKNVIFDLFKPQGSQYFVRVSSDRSLESWSDNPAFIAVMNSLILLRIPSDGLSVP